MSQKTNRTAIGAFVVGGLTLAVLAVAFFGSADMFKTKHVFVCFFEGSVGGLDAGAPVVFRGVKVGQVSAVHLNWDQEKQTITIPVLFELVQQKEGEASPEQMRKRFQGLIDAGLRATLETQSLVTGQMQIGLDLKPETEKRILGLMPEYPEIPTVQTPLAELMKKLEKLPIQEIVESVERSVKSLERILASEGIEKAVSEVARASTNAADLMQDARATVGSLEQRVGKTLDGVDAALLDMRKVLANLDDRISALAPNLDGAVTDARGTLTAIREEAQALSDRMVQAVAGVEATLTEVRASAAEVRKSLSNDSPYAYRLATTLGEFDATLRSLKALTDRLQRNPEALLFGRQK